MTNEQEPDEDKGTDAEAHEAVEGTVPPQPESPQEAATNPEPAEHTRTIGDRQFRCIPKVQGGVYDPTEGRTIWERGIEYWCIPFEREFGRRYDSKGRIDPNIVD